MTVIKLRQRVILGISAIALAICGLGPVHSAEQRVALVIGNGTYQHAPSLSNPRNDAADLGEKLNRLGFQLFGGQDMDRTTMLGALTAFGRAAEKAEVALVFYAGHGLQINGQNYLVPVDANVAYEAEADIALVPFNVVMQQLNRGSSINIAILDACRDNPFAKDLSRTMGTRAVGVLGRGLGRAQSVSGSFIAYATQPDNVALDGSGRNSPFTASLLKHIERPELSISDLMIEVRKEVIATTGGKQVPWDSSSLTGRFSFKIEGTVEIVPAGPRPSETLRGPSTPQHQPVDSRALEFSVWSEIQKSKERGAFEKFLRDFPDGVFASAARERIAALSARSVAPEVKPEVEPEARPEACSHPPVIDDDFTKAAASAGIAHGVVFSKGQSGGATFSRRRESRIVYPYERTGLPRSGTLEWLVNVTGGYSYSSGKLTERNGCALIFTTDIQNGDVTWPGSAWLYVCNNGDIRFHIAGGKYEAGGRPEFRLEVKGSGFRYGEWHRIGVSYGEQGRFIVLDGTVVASDANMTQKLGAGGTHTASIDHPTIGESVSGFWPNNQHEGGFEGRLARFRASDMQQDWCITR